MDQAGGPQGVVVDDTVSVERDGRLDGGGHLVGELVTACQQPPGDRRHLFRPLCFVTIRVESLPQPSQGSSVQSLCACTRASPKPAFAAQ